MENENLNKENYMDKTSSLIIIDVYSDYEEYRLTTFYMLVSKKDNLETDEENDKYLVTKISNGFIFDDDSISTAVENKVMDVTDSDSITLTIRYYSLINKIALCMKIYSMKYINDKYVFSLCT